jgi:hypothetical protein
MKIVEIFLILWGKWFELEPEFLTSWSRSHKNVPAAYQVWSQSYRIQTRIALRLRLLLYKNDAAPALQPAGKHLRIFLLKWLCC